MEIEDFVIPLKPENLEESAEGKYCVKSVLEIDALRSSDIFNFLEEIDTCLTEKKAFSITKHENFDVLYSLINKYSILEGSIRNKMLEILLSGLTSLVSSIALLFDKNELQANPTEFEFALKVHRVALKMYVFLLNWIISMHEKEEIESSKKTKKRKGKKAYYEEADSEWKERVIQAFITALEAPLARLWKRDKPEEAFLLLFYKTAFKMLENPNNIKIKSVKEAIFQLIIACLRYNVDATGAASSIVSLIMQHEHVGTSIAELLEAIIADNERSVFPNKVFVEIGSIDGSDLGKDKDASGAKNLSNFIAAAGEKLPRCILANMSILLPHLNDESYVMRNGILYALSRVISGVLVQQENTEINISTRDSLLGILEERFRDTNAYTRSKVIQCWAHLCEKKAVPLNLLPTIVDLVIGRLYDKSAFVRKSAIQFLITILEYNPYGHTLKKSILQSKLSETTQQLKDAVEIPDKQRQKLTSLVAYYSEGIKFVEQIENAIPIVCKLLDSKTSSDVLECVKLISCAYAFKIEAANIGIKAMLKLVWSREQSIKDGVITTFSEIYLSEKLTSPEKCLSVAKNLVQLASSCVLAELSAMEAIISELVSKDDFSEKIVLALWEIYSLNATDVTEIDALSSIIILGMVATSKPEIIRKKLKTLIKNGLGERALKFPNLAIYTCSVLEKLSRKTKDDKEEYKLDQDHVLFKQLTNLIVGDEIPLRNWVQFAERAVSVIFSLCKTPSDLSESIIKRLESNLRRKKSDTEDDGAKVSVDHLTKLISYLGHAALRELKHLEIQFKEAKRLKQEAKKNKKEKELSKIEEELGLDSKFDEHELEEIFEEKERNLISENTIYGSFIPLIVTICADADNRFGNSLLRNCAVLTLCKFMCISQTFCEKYLQLLFTLLASSNTASTIRINIIVSVGDMACRFPNTIEPWTPQIYKCLRDPDYHVRKKTLMLLTYLILNDMIKAKSNISEIARCIEDKDNDVAIMAKTFFNEFSKKGGNNSIYNILPDTISHLTADQVSDDSFRNIMKFLLSFVDKDRQIEKLVEKLCNRFKSITDDVNQWRDIAFCLSMLNYNDKAIKKLIENLKNYQHTLFDHEIYESIHGIAIKHKKSLKDETKREVAEWEAEIEKLYNKMSEDKDYDEKLKNVKPSRRIVKKETKPKRGRRKKIEEEEEEEEELEEEEEEEELSDISMLDEEEDEIPNVKQEEIEDVEMEDVEMDDEEEEEKPKRRGRTKKQISDEEEWTIKRKGRKSKRFIDDDEWIEEDEKPKRRGRKPKEENRRGKTKSGRGFKKQMSDDEEDFFDDE